MRYLISQIQDYVGANTWHWEMIAVEADGRAETVTRVQKRKDLPSIPEARKILAERKARREAMMARPPCPPPRPTDIGDDYW